MKSYIAKPADIDHKWYVIDAEDKTLGKVAAEIAMILRGKKKPIYTPHVDCGDYVVVVNAEKVAVTARRKSRRFTRATVDIQVVSRRQLLQNFALKSQKRSSVTLLRA